MNGLTVTQDHISQMIDMSDKADSTKYQYKKAVRNYLATGNNLTDSKALQMYAQTISNSERAFLKAAIRLWTEQIALQAKSSSTPETVNAVTATLHRLDALNESIPSPKPNGTKAHIWLTLQEVRQLVNACPNDIYGKRDRIILSVMLSAGLRREELSNLTFDAIKQQGDRTVLQVKGKGAKDRVIPISDRLVSLLDEWHQLVGDGYIARSVGMNREIGDSLSGVQIFRIVRQYGEKIGKPKLAAHDLRRTYAQLGYGAGIPITQISKLLGHSSIATTQRYLDLELDLETTVSDFIPI